MPSLSALTQGNAYETYIGSSVPSTPQYVGTRTLYQFQHDRTNTVRRAKPTDLFANSTFFTSNTLTLDARMATATKFPYRYYAPGTFYNGATHQIPHINTSGQLAYLRQAGDGRLRAKIKDMNVNLAQSIAEYRQACLMFGDLARDIVKALRSLRSGYVLSDVYRTIKRANDPSSKRLANRWLQYQYGLKPVVMDLYGLCEEIGKNLDSGITRYVDSKVKDKVSKDVFWPGNLFPAWTYTTQTTSYRVRARYKIRRAGLKQLSQVGITNPALLVWELIPYSFVVDWMFPVGNYLSAIDSLNGVSDLQVVRGYFCETVTQSMAPGGTHRKDVWKQRTAVASDLAMPPLAYKSSKSLTSVLNGLALLNQLRKF